MLGSLTLLSQVLAVRMVLLVSVLGAIFLAYLALSEESVLRLGVLGIYCATALIPVVALTYRRG